jgi:hypothetical protein
MRAAILTSAGLRIRCAGVDDPRGGRFDDLCELIDIAVFG